MVWHWFRHRLRRDPADSGKNTKIMTNFKVYILKSFNFNRYYVGHSADTEKRLSEHNSGKVRSIKAYNLGK